MQAHQPLTFLPWSPISLTFHRGSDSSNFAMVCENERTRGQVRRAQQPRRRRRHASGTKAPYTRRLRGGRQRVSAELVACTRACFRAERSGAQKRAKHHVRGANCPLSDSGSPANDAPPRPRSKRARALRICARERAGSPRRAPRRPPTTSAGSHRPTCSLARSSSTLRWKLSKLEPRTPARLKGDTNSSEAWMLRCRR